MPQGFNDHDRSIEVFAFDMFFFLNPTLIIRTESHLM